MTKNDTIDVQAEKIPLNKGLEEALMEHPSFQWLKENSKFLSYGFLALLLLSILLYRLLASQTANREQDYFSMNALASSIENTDTTQEKRQYALSELRGLVNQYPSLEAKYDGLIGEQLLLEKEIEASNLYTSRTFKRVDGAESPFYLDYATTSILLAENKTEQALKAAYDLRKKMLATAAVDSKSSYDASFGGVLYAFNLIRIALIEKQSGTNNLEFNAWNELQSLETSSLIKISSQDFERIMTHFDTEGVKLNTFIRS